MRLNGFRKQKAHFSGEQKVRFITAPPSYAGRRQTQLLSHEL